MLSRLRAVGRLARMRQLPHGLLGLGYLWPRSEQVRRHRSLWWDGMASPPRLPRLLFELWLWLAWVGFRAWRASWRMLRHQGAEVRAREGLALWRQYIVTLCLTLRWCIPPSAVYRFRLHRAPDRALGYIYDQESEAFHRQRSRALGLKQESLRLLQDKQELARRLAEAGLPVVPTRASISRGGAVVLQELVGSEVLFCKARAGAQGRGAFTVWREGAHLRGRRYDGGELADEAAVEQAWSRLLGQDDVLVQPCLDHHPHLAALGGDDGTAMTVRFISQRQGGDMVCVLAVLELPVSGGHTSRSWLLLPVEAESGRLLAPPDIPYPSAVAARLAELEPVLPAVGVLPHWNSVREGSYAAHALFPDVCAIAWDWIITGDGACLLEGNFNWGTRPLQMFQGGLLAAPAPQRGAPSSSR